MSSQPTVVAFDVDGTLTERDCVVPFLIRTAGLVRLSLRMLRMPLALAGAVVRRERDAFKALASKAGFAGREVAAVAADAGGFAEHVRSSWMRSDVLAELEAAQAAGSVVVLVSASYEIYLRPLGELLGVDDVIATRLAEVDGRLTGSLDGPNCRGAEKVNRLHAWLDEHHGGRDSVTVRAYGDSAGDFDMLADADDGVWVGSDDPPPGTRLLAAGGDGTPRAPT